MKLLGLLQFIVAVSSGLLNEEEFLDMTSRILSHRMGSLSPFKTTCNERLAPNSSGKYECYAITAGDIKAAFTHSSFAPEGTALKFHSPSTSLLSALYFAEGSLRNANHLLQDNVDFVLITMKKHPQCRVVHYGLEKLADTQSGPGSISISESHVTKSSHGWRVGTSVSYKSPAGFLFGGGSVDASADYSGSIEISLESAIGLSLDIPKNATCTPYLIQYSLLCDRVEAEVVFGKNNSLYFLSSVQKSSKPVLLPLLKNKSPTFFETAVGCIDYST